MKGNFVRVSQAKDLIVKPATLYKWRHLGKYPQLFSQVGVMLFVDLDALDALVEGGRGQRRAQVKRQARAATVGAAGMVAARPGN